MEQLIEDNEHGRMPADEPKQLRSVLASNLKPYGSSQRLDAIKDLAFLLSRCTSEEICQYSVATLQSILDFNNDKAISSLGDLDILARKLVSVLIEGRLSARIDVAHLLRGIAKANKNGRVSFSIGDTPSSVEGLVGFLKDDVSQQAVEAVLDTLLILCIRSKRYRLRAVAAGGVQTIVEVLPKTGKVACEKALSFLQLLLSCYEGRCAVLENRSAIPAITKKLLRVSEMATDSGVAALWTMCEHSGESSEQLRNEIMQAGGFGKLIVILQLSRMPETKQKAGHLIKLLDARTN